MKSIMHSKAEHTCYLCILLNADHSEKVTYEHHILYGTANRKLSEKYGLKVYLCLKHHTNGPAAVHNNQENNRLLRRMAQEAFERKYVNLSFREIFGTNYLDTENIGNYEIHEIYGSQAAAVLNEGTGFLPLEDGLQEIDWEI